MTTQTTSLGPANSGPTDPDTTSGGQPPAELPKTFLGQWRHFFQFLRQPQLPAQTTRFGDGLRATMRMLVLDLAIMVVLLGMVLIAVLSGFELPANALDDLEMTAPIILGIVVAAPVIEEVIFRSWLSGKPGHVLAIAIVVIGVAAMVGVNLTIASPPLVAIIAIGALIGSLLAAFLLRKRGQMGWFARAFPWFFWGSTLVFAFIHVFNYEEGSILALLPLVLPQFALGTVCAYLRVNHGLWSAIVLHALHNGTVVLFVLSGLELLE